MPTAPPVAEKRRLRISIRYKILLVFSAVLLLAVGAYVYLATSLFTRDKLTYVFDLSSAVVETLSEQTRSNLEVLGTMLSAFALDVVRPQHTEAEREEATRRLFAAEQDLLRVQLYQAPRGGGFTRSPQSFVNEALLPQAGLTKERLQELHRERPLPLAAIAAEPGKLYVQNSSLPPASAILTVAVAYPREGGTLVVAADFRHERLLRIFGNAKLHETYLVDQRGEIIAHPEASRVIQHVNLSKHPMVQEALDSKSEPNGVREFRAEDRQPWLGAYARVGVGRLVVLTQLPKHEALRASDELIKRSVLFAAAVLLAALLASVFLSRLLTAQIRRLRAATDVMGQGRFDVHLDVVRSRDEIGDLARAFERMATALKDAQASLVRSEKMAAFGQLGAGITHEVKNPLTGIIGFAQIAQRRMEEPTKVVEMLKLIETEGKRCSEILINFLKFARTSNARDVERVDLKEVVSAAGRVFAHQLLINQVKLELDLQDAPAVLGNSGELQQVLLNLAMNAQQAMPEGGKLKLSTGVTPDGQAQIAIADNGPGVPEELRDKIFEPFFTTKPPGEGTGLGLAVSFGIVRDHGGTITVESAVGQGTTFFIRLPPAPTAAAPPHSASGDRLPAEAERRISHG